MINLKALKENNKLIEKILLKDPLFEIDLLIDNYDNFLKHKIELEELLGELNKLSKFDKNNPITDEKKNKSKELSLLIEEKKKEFIEIEKKFYDLYLKCGNIIFEDVPAGGKENNLVVKIFGERTSFDFTPKNHADLFSDNNFVNFNLGTKICKSGFIVYEDKVALILYKLCMIFLQINRKNGFKVIIPPSIANEETLTAASNLPRFQEDLFKIEQEKLYLIPTSEVSIAYIHSNEILDELSLPLRYTAWTKCFRKEAGGYGSNERGLIRIHEFDKVEIFSFTKEEDSEKEHLFMLSCVEEILQKLQLHYRISLLAAQDCSFASAKTYDFEVWLPGQNQYREVSSVSNCTDYQSRRSKTRYRDKNDNSIKLVHTLNGSSLAIPRIMVALFEKYQNSNSTINFDLIFDLLNKIEKDICDKIN